jgi:predicted dehydrogenase
MAQTRVALIGLGAVAREIHLPALADHPVATLIAVADPDPKSREVAAPQIAGARCYVDPESMLRAEQPDLVIIATPPQLHRDHCLLALRHGAHVLCEKPFMESLAEADEVIAVAASLGRVVAVNHQYRFLPFYSRPASQVRAGVFGRPYYAHAQQHMHLTREQESGWRGELHRRVLFEFGGHVVDLLTYFFGSEPVAVSARMPRVVSDDPTDVLVVLRLDYPNDRVATVVLNRASRGAPRYLDVRLECERASLRMSFGGVAEFRVGWSRERRRPTVRLSIARGGEAWAEADGRTWRLARALHEARPYATARLLSSVIEAIAAHAEPAVSAGYARSLLRIILAAYESAERGGELVSIAAADGP